jgi:hypothetical protein
MSDIFWATLVGSLAYLLKGWVDDNHLLRSKKIDKATVVAEAIGSLLRVFHTQGHESFELQLRAVKESFANGIFYFSLSTEKAALEFFAAANLMSTEWLKTGAPDTGLVKKVEAKASKFSDALRQDCLGFSWLGLRFLWDSRRGHRGPRHK